MARNKIGDVFSRMAAFVGIVDEDDEPKVSRKRASEDYRNDTSDRDSGYSPRVRRNDRSQSAQSRVRTTPYNRDDDETASRSGSARKSESSRRKDTYSDWNTAPRSSNRYADSIYDDDTTARGETNRNYSYDDDSYDNGYDEDFSSRSRQQSRSRKPASEAEEPRAKSGRNSSSAEVVVLEMNSLADCKGVILSLLSNKTVFISVESMPREMIRRVEDTLSGAVFALDATFRQTSEVSYLLAPNSIAVSGTRRTTERNY